MPKYLPLFFVATLFVGGCTSYQGAVYETDNSILVLGRRPAHWFLAEHRRELGLLRGGIEISHIDLMTDSGGKSRANLYRLEPNKLLVVDYFGAYLVDLNAGRISLGADQSLKGEYIGAFDEDSGDWVFVSASERKGNSDWVSLMN